MDAKVKNYIKYGSIFVAGITGLLLAFYEVPYSIGFAMLFGFLCGIAGAMLADYVGRS